MKRNFLKVEVEGITDILDTPPGKKNSNNKASYSGLLDQDNRAVPVGFADQMIPEANLPVKKRREGLPLEYVNGKPVLGRWRQST